MSAFITEFWQVLAEMSPYLLLGFLFAGMLSVWVPANLIERHLGGYGWWPVLKASLLGIPLPICSCGVIPVAASLKKHGASRGATTSFLLSTPQTGVDSIFVTLSLLGPLYAIYRPVAALITGVVGGVIVDAVDRTDNNGSQVKEVCTDACCNPENQDSALKRIWEYGFITLPRDIGKTLLVGLLIAALISAIVPEGFIPESLSGIWAMLAMLVLSIPMYVCATGSVPVAAALIATGFSPGAALVFLVAGPATNAAAITTIWKILGPRATITYLAVVAAGAFGGGLALNALFSATSLPVMQHGMFMLPAWINHASAILLLALLAYVLWPRRAKEITVETKDDEQLLVLDVKGMNCQHCVKSVQTALSGQAGVSNVQVDLGAAQAYVTGRGFQVDELISAVSSAGFTAKPKD
ncbi:SO_0444 family Cu/Zn efflux transporter [bacterium]|nr:SO_0444 family Cu/Zn efflux transporter [bacterium]